MSDSLNFDLDPADNSRLANLCGQFNEHLQQVGNHFDVGIDCRSNHFEIHGDSDNRQAAMNTIKNLYEVAVSEKLEPSLVQLYLADMNADVADDFDEEHSGPWSVRTRKGVIKGRGRHQKQ